MAAEVTAIETSVVPGAMALVACTVPLLTYARSAVCQVVGSAYYSNLIFVMGCARMQMVVAQEECSRYGEVYRANFFAMDILMVKEDPASFVLDQQL